MKKLLALAVSGAAMTLAGQAPAQEFPTWRVSAICAPGDDTCPHFETRTRGRIAAVWLTVPPDVRTACLQETAAVGRSYRLLFDCVSHEMQRMARMAQAQRPKDTGDGAMPKPETPGEEAAGEKMKTDKPMPAAGDVTNPPPKTPGKEASGEMMKKDEPTAPPPAGETMTKDEAPAAPAEKAQ